MNADDPFDELWEAVTAAANDPLALARLEMLIGRRPDLNPVSRSTLEMRLRYHQAEYCSRHAAPDRRDRVATLDPCDRSTFALGGPQTPSQARDQLMQQADVGPPADLLFRFEAAQGILWPAGMMDNTFLRPAPCAGRFASGAITATGHDHCIAVFAQTDSDARPRAEELLRRWADQDEWHLSIRADVSPLPPFGDKSWHAKECTACGYRWSVAAITMPYFTTVAFSQTRCPFCRIGRRLPVKSNRSNDPS